MTRNDDFDQTLAAWLRREAPPQAPDRVLDAALERVAAQSQQQGWLNRLQRGTQMGRIVRVTAVAAMVAIAAFIGFEFSNLTSDVGNSPSPSASASAEPTQTGAPSTSSSPAPSADPAVGRLVLRLDSGTDLGLYHVVTVLEDGRIITTSGQGAANPFVERRLTAAGVQLLRDELDATRLTDTSANYPPVPKPGIEPPGRGHGGHALEVGLSGGGTAVISWVGVADDEDLYYEPSPEREALDALAARLSTLDEWLPANAWADANARPYAPARYRIYIYSLEWGGSLDDLPVEVATVSWPLDEAIDAFGDVMLDPAGQPVEGRCGVVSAEEATAVMEALEAAGARLEGQTWWITSSLGDRANDREVRIILEWIMPDETSCEGVGIHF
jgi:hypothetical protein